MAETFGTIDWGLALWGGSAAPAEVEEWRVPVYRLELRDKYDHLISILPNYTNARWTKEVNVPDILTFDYPVEDADIDYFVQPYQIWLRDVANGELKQRFRIIEPTVVGHDVERISVECRDFMSQLADERITLYEATAEDGLTVEDVLNDLLDFQTNPKKVTLKHIDSSYGSQPCVIKIVGKSILEAINTLHETVGGQFAVDCYRRLIWKQKLGTNFGRQLRYRKNLRGIKRVGPSFDELVNRLYAYGAGSGESRLTLLDAGEPNEYIDNTESIDDYNVHAGEWTDATITDAAELLAKAQVVLESKSTPRISYEVSAADLAADATVPRAYERIELGTVYRVIDEPLGIDTTQSIIKVERNLTEPVDVTVTTTNIPRTMADLFEKINKEIYNAKNAVSVGDDLPLEPATEASAGTSPYAARADHVHPFSDEIPDNWLDDEANNIEPVGDTPAAGTSTKAARIDHVHDIDPEKVSTVLSNNAIANYEIARGIGGNPAARAELDIPEISTETPEADTADGDAGTGTKASAEDHQHPRSDIYCRRFEQSGEPDVEEDGVQEGDIWIDTDDDRVYLYSNLKWRRIGAAYIENTSPYEPQEGDIWTHVSEGEPIGSPWIYNQGAWTSIVQRIPPSVTDADPDDYEYGTIWNDEHGAYIRGGIGSGLSYTAAWRPLYPVMLSDEEPDPEYWQQGMFWIDTDDSGVVKQVWLKTDDDSSSNASAVALGKMTTETLS